MLRLPLSRTGGGGGISGGENFAGKISPLRKVAKFSPCRNSCSVRQVSTMNSDMRSGVPRREKGPGMFLFATCSGCARNALECRVAPGFEKKNRHWSVSRERHLPFCCRVTHYLWKQQTCKPVMQTMLHPHTGPFVPMVVTCRACPSDRHFFCFLAVFGLGKARS